jgi:hypothetical protein
MGNRWGKGKREWVAWGGEVSIQPIRDLSGWESHHDAKEGFQVRREFRNRGRDFQAKGGYQKDRAVHLRYHTNLVHIVLIVYMSC